MWGEAPGQQLQQLRVSKIWSKEAKDWEEKKTTPPHPAPTSFQNCLRRTAGSYTDVLRTGRAVHCYCNQLYYFVKYFYKYLRGVHICNIKGMDVKYCYLGFCTPAAEHGVGRPQRGPPPYLYIGLCATTQLNLLLNSSICCCCLNIV